MNYGFDYYFAESRRFIDVSHEFAEIAKRRGSSPA